MENTTRIVEIDGIKLEIDLRAAKKIEHYKVGDNVRVLVKSYGDDYKVHPGVITGFDEFAKLPTLIITYLEIGYNTADVKFAYINGGKESKDSKYEIAPAHDLQELFFKKGDVMGMMNREIEKKSEEMRDLQAKKEYFEKYFSKYFEVKEQIG